MTGPSTTSNILLCSRFECLILQYIGKVSSIFYINSEAFASEFIWIFFLVTVSSSRWIVYKWLHGICHGSHQMVKVTCMLLLQVWDFGINKMLLSIILTY